MLTKKANLETVEKKNVYDGKNHIFSSTLIEIPDWKGAGRAFHKVVVPPQGEIGYHVHEGDSESYYVLSGSGVYNDNGTKTKLSAGDLSFTPDGCGHGIYNDTDEDLVLLACILYNFKKGEDITGLRKIRRAGTFTRKELHAPFDGKGDFYGFLLMEGDEFTGAARVYNMMHMLPNCKLGYHPHDGETEVFYIVSGKGIFTDDDKEFDVEAGDVLLTGTGHGHALENKGNEELVYAALIYYDKD